MLVGGTMNKKINIEILLFVIICLFLIAATIAFIIRSTTANNVITFGNLKMQLIQTTLDKNNQEQEVANNEDITHKPVVNRIVKIKNVGKHEFFVRVSPDIVGTDANNHTFNANEVVSYQSSASDWVYKDGWYYYKKIVKRNETTSNLMANIRFDLDKITANYPKGQFKLNIKAEAVQAENNAGSALEAMGWPTK